MIKYPKPPVVSIYHAKYNTWHKYIQIYIHSIQILKTTNILHNIQSIRVNQKYMYMYLYWQNHTLCKVAICIQVWHFYSTEKRGRFLKGFLLFQKFVSVCPLVISRDAYLEILFDNPPKYYAYLHPYFLRVESRRVVSISQCCRCFKKCFEGKVFLKCVKCSCLLPVQVWFSRKWICNWKDHAIHAK